MDVQEEKIVIDSAISPEHVAYMKAMLDAQPSFRGKKIESIEVLPGGLTNFNFKVMIDQIPYAIRVAGKGTSQFINRPAEHYNAMLMADKGINCQIFFHDEVTGDQVAAFIEGKTLHIPDFHEEPQWLVKTAEVMKIYHNSDEKLASRFALLDEIDNYEKLVADKNVTFYDGPEKPRAAVNRIKAAYAINPPKEVPCHNDTLPENWVVNDHEIKLIDWEYAGMNDPNFDLAAVSLENSLSPEEEMILLKAYYGENVTDENFGRVVINKFLCDYLWALWSVLQIENGKPYDEYWPYGLNRFDRANGFIDDGSLDKAIAAISK